MDLVHIGYKIDATGIQEANKQVDALLSKTDKLNRANVKVGGTGFSQTTKSVKDTSSSLDRMIERQKTLSSLLPYMDKSMANLSSTFWMASKEVNSFNKYLDLLENNKAIVTQKKQAEALAQAQAKAAEQVKTTISSYEMLSNKSFGGGVLDQVEKQNKSLSDMRKHYQDIESEQNKQNKTLSETVAKYERLSSKSLGGGVLDQVDKQNKSLSEMRKYYQGIEDSQNKQLSAEQRINEARARALQLEQAKNKYIQQGFSTTSAGQLASLEIGGASISDIQKRAAAIRDNTKALQELNQPTNEATQSHNKLLASIKGIAIYAALSAAIYGVMTAMTSFVTASVTMADQYTAIQNRMKLYISDANTLKKVNAQLAQYAIENNVGLKETATLYARLAPSMQRIGANTAAITTVVDAFGKSMRIGGATAQEAASATIQFSQAMASGKLAGDEFRSISEASPRFLKAIADGSGIAADKLKAMSSAGQLTTEVISKALLKVYPQLIEENKKLGITMEQGANAIKTGFLVAIGEFNEGAGITKSLGESMADLGTYLFKVGQTAKEAGANFSKFFSDNADTINTVLSAFKLLTIFIVSKYVVGLVLAQVETLRYQATLLSMAATQAGVTRSTLLMTTAVTAFGKAASAAFTAMGGWVGIIATIATVAGTYLLLRDNAAQSSEKIVEQSKYVDLTTESYKKLTAEQQKNAQVSLSKDISDINAKLNEQKEQVDSVLTSYKRFYDRSGVILPTGMTTVIEQATKGLISYDTAYRKLIELKAPTDVIENFKKQKDIYDETAKSALKLEPAAKAAGIGIQLAGNQAQNATPSVVGMKDATNDLGDTAIITGQKLSAFATSMKELTVKYQNILALRKQTGLNDTYATKVLEEADRVATQEESIKKSTDAISKAREAINKAKAAGKNVSIQEAAVNRAEVETLRKKNDLAKSYAIQLAPQAKLAQEAQDANSAYTKDLKKQQSEADKIAKANGKIVDKYEAQEETAIRLNNYLKQGVTYSVAKIASEDKYNKVFGSSLDTAEKIAKARQEAADIAEKAQARENSSRSLKQEAEDYKTILALMKEGYSYAVARQTVQDGFSANASGYIHSNNLITKSLRDQSTETKDQVLYQESLLDFVKQGYTVEEASNKVAVYRNKHLAEAGQAAGSLMLTFADIAAQAKRDLDIATNRVALEVEANTYKEQALVLTKTTKSELASTMMQYKGISVEEAQHLQTQKDIVAKLTERNALLEDQKSLTDAINNVNFDVFGDLGNPFKSALEGLNGMIFGVDELDQKYKRMYADLDTQIAKSGGDQNKQQSLVLEKAALEEQQVYDTKKARDKAITSALVLTKSFFNENSKGYKVITRLEQIYQASKIAYSLWEKKDQIQMLAVKLAGYAQEASAFAITTATKMAAQLGFNVAKGTEAILTQGTGDPYTAFARMAAMAGVVAALGVAISGSFGSSGSKSAPTSNTGIGTVLGDSTKASESIKNSVESLSDNSDLMLPLTSSMLKSLLNIESNIGGLSNLIVRGNVGSNLASTVQQGSITTNATKVMSAGLNAGISYLTKAAIATSTSALITSGSAIGAAILSTTSTVVSSISSALSVSISTVTGALSLGAGLLLGQVLAKPVAKLVNSLFGVKKTVVAQGLYIADQNLGDVVSKGINLQEYVDIQTKKKSWGNTKTSYSTVYGKASDELSNQFTSIFSNVYVSVLSAAQALSYDLGDVVDRLNSYVISIGKIDLKGLSSDEIQKKLEEVLGAEFDKIAKFAVPGLDDFQKVGEGYYETLTRVASAVEEASYYTDLLKVSAIKYTDVINKQADDIATEIIRQSYLAKNGISTVTGGMSDLVANFSGTASEITDFITTLEKLQTQMYMTGQSGDYLTSSMILGAGGLDALSSGFDAYFEMLSPAEQAAELTRRMTKEFNDLGLSLPSDVKAFRDLVKGIDLTTAEGQKLYGEVIALAPEFNDLQDAISSANSEINDLVKSLRDLADQAKSARGETESTRTLDSLRAEFDAVSKLAMQGDTDAANKLVDLGSSLMTASKSYATSTSQYAADLASIQRAATIAADIQESGLGTTVSTNLTATTTSSTTSSTTTTNDKLDTLATKLDTLTTSLESGMYAVAKYTQDTATRLERWDYGDRVLVRVEQDGNTDSVPVKVIT